MKTKIVALFALPLLMSSAFAAQTLTYNVDTVISGTTLPVGSTPWLTVSLTEIDSDSVLLNVVSNLQNAEFFSGIGINLTDSITYSNRSFDTYNQTGNFSTPTVLIGPNVKNGGAGIKYDVWFDLPTQNNEGQRFGADDQFSYTLNGFSLSDFDSNRNSVGAHIQSLSDGKSIWVGTNNVPEPTSMLLGSLALLTLFRRRRG